MASSDLILYITSKMGTIPGRTSLQKLCYFADLETSGAIPFKPHYYGPYSSEVANNADALLSYNYLDERKETGSLSSPWTTAGGTVITDWERRSYTITSDGDRYLSRLSYERRAELAKADKLLAALKEATNLDPTKLSTLAKVHFVVTHDGASRSDRAAILAAIKANGWKLSVIDVNRALKTLGQLHL